VRAEEPAVLAHPEARRRLSEALIDTLVSLHAIDVAASGLSTLGKPAASSSARLRGWSERVASIENGAPCRDGTRFAEWLRDSPAGRIRRNRPSSTATSSSIT